MPPRKGRRCRRIGGRRGFRPLGVPMDAAARQYVTLDEFEVLRLCDLEGKTQAAAGEFMGVSRGTVQRLAMSARTKVVDALLNQKILILLDEAERIGPRRTYETESADRHPEQ